jgi:Flp pilus assembly protein CpaB
MLRGESNIVHSRRILGAVALGAIVIAAVSFAIVDVSIADANQCVGSAIACADESVPPIAISFAALGALALLVSILPTVQWIVDSIHTGRTSNHDADIEEAVLARRRTRALARDDRF